LSRLPSNCCLICRSKQPKRLAVDIHDADALHTTRHRLGVTVQVLAEIFHALLTQRVEESLEGGVIFLPQRDGGIFEQTQQVPLGVFTAGDVLNGHQHLPPGLLGAGQDAPGEQDVHRPAVQGVVDALARPGEEALPERQQFVAEMMAHLVAEKLGQVGDQIFLRWHAVHRQRLTVDAQDANAGHAGLDFFRVRIQMRRQVAHPLSAQCLEAGKDGAEILLHQSNGSILEQHRKIPFTGHTASRSLERT
jgi:hypothetical protein